MRSAKIRLCARRGRKRGDVSIVMWRRGARPIWAVYFAQEGYSAMRGERAIGAAAPGGIVGKRISLTRESTAAGGTDGEGRGGRPRARSGGGMPLRASTQSQTAQKTSDSAWAAGARSFSLRILTRERRSRRCQLWMRGKEDFRRARQAERRGGEREGGEARRAMAFEGFTWSERRGRRVAVREVRE